MGNEFLEFFATIERNRGAKSTPLGKNGNSSVEQGLAALHVVVSPSSSSPPAGARGSEGQPSGGESERKLGGDMNEDREGMLGKKIYGRVIQLTS